MGAIVSQALALVAAHWDVIELVVDAIEKKMVSKDRLIAVIKHEMTEASDSMMRAKYPEEG